MSDLAKTSGSSPPLAGLLLEYIRVNAPCTERNILDSVRGRRQTKVLELRKLVESGLVVRDGLGNKVSPFRYKTADALPDPLEESATRIPAPNVAGENASASYEQLSQDEFHEVLSLFQMLIIFRDQRKNSTQQDKIEPISNGTDE